MQFNKKCLPNLGCLARSGLWVGALLLLSHCGQIGRDASRSSFVTKSRAGSFSSVYTIFTSANCTQCHAPNGGSAAAGNGTAIDFTSQDSAYRTLTGGAHVQGSGAGSACANVLLVDGTPAQSYLPFAIFSADSDFASAHFDKGPGCTPYPVAGHAVNFSPDEKASILAWIQAGAPND